MANQKIGKAVDATKNYEGVVVDTDPGEDGYYSDPVYINYSKTKTLWFEVTEITGATVSLLMMGPDDTEWSVYGEYTEVTSLIVGGFPGTQFKCGVADNNQGTTSRSKLIWGV